MGRLVNLGSLCIDHVYRVRELVCAGETASSISHEVFAGGKGLNQSLAAARAGARVAHVGCVGEDGLMLVDQLASAGVDVTGVRRLEDTASGHAVIQVNDHGENAIVIAGGANRSITEQDLDVAFAGLVADDWLLLQNEINDLDQVLSRAAACPAGIAFNVAPVDGRERAYDLSNVDLLIVNEIEAAALCTDDATLAPREVLATLAERFPATTVVLTLGAEGVLFVQPDAGIAALPSFAVPVVDETAAGDAFIGYCLAALLAGESAGEALRQGCAAGALAVTRAGAASSIPLPDAVAALLEDNRVRESSVP